MSFRCSRRTCLPIWWRSGAGIDNVQITVSETVGLEDRAGYYDGAGAPKGEVTVVVAPPGEKAPASDAEIDRRLAEALAVTSVRNAVQQVTAATGVSRRQVYARALAIRKVRSSRP